MSQPTITTLHNNGIRTAMITGDTPLTAFAVAKAVGILKPGRQLFTAHLVSNTTAPVPPLEPGSVFNKHTSRLKSRSKYSLNFDSSGLNRSLIRPGPQ